MADIFEFENFVQSSRGLMARPILPNNKAALRADIETVGFVCHNITDNVEIAAGALDPAIVMFPLLQKPWRKDDTGFSFLWAFPGNYVPDPGKKVRFKITFTIIPTHVDPQLQGKSFVMVYQADTKDPLA
jgi:hypothetical protein